jgi:hypothetical protein
MATASKQRTLGAFREQNPGRRWSEEFAFPVDLPPELDIASPERTELGRLAHYALLYLHWRYSRPGAGSAYFPILAAIRQFRANEGVAPRDYGRAILGLRSADIAVISAIAGGPGAPGTDRLLRRLDSDLSRLYQRFCETIYFRANVQNRDRLADLMASAEQVEWQNIEPMIGMARSTLMRMKTTEVAALLGRAECSEAVRTLLVQIIEAAAACDAERTRCPIHNPMCGSLPPDKAVAKSLGLKTLPDLPHRACRPPWFLAAPRRPQGSKRPGSATAAESQPSKRVAP